MFHNYYGKTYIYMNIVLKRHLVKTENVTKSLTQTWNTSTTHSYLLKPLLTSLRSLATFTSKHHASVLLLQLIPFHVYFLINLFLYIIAYSSHTKSQHAHKYLLLPSTIIKYNTIILLIITTATGVFINSMHSASIDPTMIISASNTRIPSVYSSL